VAIARACVESAELTAEVLSVLLSVLVTPFALIVTEQEIIAPLGVVGRFQELEVLLEVTASEVCVIPSTSRL
jgi:hypothetical protein